MLPRTADRGRKPRRAKAALHPGYGLLLLAGCWLLLAGCEPLNQLLDEVSKVYGAKRSESVDRSRSSSRQSAASQVPSAAPNAELAAPSLSASAQFEVNTAGFLLPVPNPPLQELACAEHGLVRLTEDGFVAYRAAPFERITSVRGERFHSATRVTSVETLLLGPSSSRRYLHGQLSAQTFSRAPALGPGEVFPDVERVGFFWVHFLRDEALLQFELLPRAESGAAGVKRDVARVAATLTTVSLSGADGRLVVRLPSGAALFTRGRELVWQLGSQRRAYAVADVAPELVGLAPSPRTDQVWVVDAARGATLIELALGRPVRSQFELGGMPVSFAVLGDVFAAVVVEQGAHSRRFFVRVYRAGSLRYTTELPELTPGVGDWLGQVLADRDVCLFPDHPWVAFGGRYSLTIADYLSGQTVARDGGAF